MASILGAVDVASRTSAKASMERKETMGSWRQLLGHNQEDQEEVTYNSNNVHKTDGMEIQVCTSSSPGIQSGCTTYPEDWCNCKRKEPSVTAYSDPGPSRKDHRAELRFRCTTLILSV